MMRPTPLKHSGQNMVEFALPAMIIGIGVLSVMMNPAWVTAFQGEFASNNKATMDNRRLVSESYAHISGTNLAGEYMFPNVAGQEMTVPLSNGKSLKLNFKNPEDLVEVTGNDGLTTNALMALDQLIAQLTAQNPDDPKIPVLKELSKRGYAIRDAQTLIQQMLPPGEFESLDARTAFMKGHTVNFQGQDYTLQELAGQMNWFYQKNPTYNEHARELAYGANNGGFFEGYNPNERDNVEHSDALIIQFMNQLDTVRNDPGFSGADGQTVQALVNDVLAKTVFLSSVQTLFVPTKADQSTLVEKTDLSSRSICHFSRFASCTPEGTASTPSADTNKAG